MSAARLPPPSAPDLAALIRAESARLAAACTACGACVGACPMVPTLPAVAAAAPETVAAGMRAVLRGEAQAAPAGSVAWIGACTRSGLCTAACPERLDAAYMMRLAGMRLRGALGAGEEGGPPRLPAREDPGWSARVKAFARLTLTEEEQARWL
jgi:Fe-S oxidoreductase